MIEIEDLKLKITYSNGKVYFAVDFEESYSKECDLELALSRCLVPPKLFSDVLFKVDEMIDGLNA